jgi:hypothetical protein
MNTPKMVKNFQCAGCVNGETGCYLSYEYTTENIACKMHTPGTIIFPGGKVFLGLPKGFNRVGNAENHKIHIFESYESLHEIWEYDKFNIPVWKYYWKEHDVTLIKGMMSRTATIFTHIVKGNCLDKINCYEVTENDLNNMD